MLDQRRLMTGGIGLMYIIREPMKLFHQNFLGLSKTSKCETDRIGDLPYNGYIVLCV